MSRARLRNTLAVLLSVALVTGLGTLVVRQDRRAFRELDARFALTAQLAEPLLRAYVDDVLARVATAARERLTAADVGVQEFERVSRVLGFEAAVLLDEAGRLIAVHPARVDLLGSPLGSQYRHLRNARERGSGISEVVPSAADRIPVVAFAARFPVEHGQRVFSGAYNVGRSPLRAYLLHLNAATGARVDLVDTSGAVIATSRWLDHAYATLSEVDRELAMAAAHRNSGTYDEDEHAMRFATRRIAGTPWRLLMSVSEAELYAPLARSGTRWVPWALFVALSLATFGLAYLVTRLLGSRERLRAANADLDHLARVDRLTDVPNRRELEAQLSRLQSASARHEQPLSALVVDVDHFKRINDQHGHSAGDEVLRDLVRRMSTALRHEDVFGRWGGEEFVALLPNTGVEGALCAAERMRTAAAAQPVLLPDGREVRATVSIGCATSSFPPDAALIDRADAALYEAKRSGRDRVAIR